MSISQEEQLITPRGCLSRRCDLRSAYFRETFRVEKLEKQLERVSREKEMYEKAAVSLLTTIKDLLKPDYAALNLLRERLFPIPEVAALYYCVSDGVINLWIITPEENFEAEMKIADSLAELFSIFRNLKFDFMIVPRYDMKIEEIVPSGSKEVFLR